MAKATSRRKKASSPVSPKERAQKQLEQFRKDVAPLIKAIRAQGRCGRGETDLNTPAVPIDLYFRNNTDESSSSLGFQAQLSNAQTHRLLMKIAKARGITHISVGVIDVPKSSRSDFDMDRPWGFWPVSNMLFVKATVGPEAIERIFRKLNPTEIVEQGKPNELAEGWTWRSSRQRALPPLKPDERGYALFFAD